MVQTYTKGSEISLSKDFRVREFDCHCNDCHETLVDDLLVEDLQRMRDALGGPLYINSGYRCSRYQETLRRFGYETAKGKSTHEMGLAADVQTKRHRGEKLEDVARASGFHAVGVAKWWVHVDTRSDKFRRWEYLDR
jgi:uncharacterized protein YcbK (DUF882 family)